MRYLLAKCLTRLNWLTVPSGRSLTLSKAGVFHIQPALLSQNPSLCTFHGPQVHPEGPGRISGRPHLHGSLLTVMKKTVPMLLCLIFFRINAYLCPFWLRDLAPAFAYLHPFKMKHLALTGIQVGPRPEDCRLSPPADTDYQFICLK